LQRSDSPSPRLVKVFEINKCRSPDSVSPYCAIFLNTSVSSGSVQKGSSRTELHIIDPFLNLRLACQNSQWSQDGLTS
jgi:hypothetical protein